MYAQIEESTIQTVEDKNMWCLRDKRTGTVLNVSYTIDGLKWTTDNLGRLIYFKSARIGTQYNSDYEPSKLVFEGDTRVSDRVIVEPFVPTNHSNGRVQRAEYAGVHRAYKLWYNIPDA